jgi:hypothetical protein
MLGELAPVYVQQRRNGNKYERRTGNKRGITSLFGENFFRRAVPRKWSLVRAIGRWGIFQEWHDIGASRRPEDLLRFYCTRL